LFALEGDLQSEDNPRHSSFQVIAGAVSRLDASPDTPRRRWSAESKARILSEALAPGATISVVARAYGLRPQQIFTWRRRALLTGQISPLHPQGEALAFVPVEVERTSGGIELIVKDITIRVGAEASLVRLAEVIRVARSA
jgi:transposase